MNYYLLFEKFEDGEGIFTIQQPWCQVLNFYTPQSKLFKKRPYLAINEGYKERGMSDFLKVGVGMLASKKVQQIFFENGFSGIQFVPVDIRNDGDSSEYAFINATAHYDFLDPVASEAEDLSKTLGGYTSVLEEVLDIEKFRSTIIEHDCFTLSTYKDPYYVSEKVKNALVVAGITGIEFIPMEFS